MKFEEVLRHLGDFKKYQKIQCLILFVPILVTAWHTMALTFTGGTPEFRCRSQWESVCDVNATIPLENDKYSTCKKYDIINATTGCDVTNVSKTVHCTEWKYSEDVYKSSLVVEWNLVCDRIFMTAILQSTYMFGMLVGAIVLGELSDRYGRKKIYYISLVVQMVAGFSSAVSVEYVAFAICRFVLGAAHSGIYLCGFTIAMEFLGSRGKVRGAMIPHIYFGIGFMTLPGLAYLIRYWNWLQVAMTAPGLIFLSYWMLISESARWLNQKGRHDQAVEVITNAARINKVKIPSHLLELDSGDEHEPEVATSIDLLTYGPRLRRNALIIYYNWFVVSTVYYGLSLTTSGIPGGNPFMNMVLSGVAEILGYIFCIAFMNRPGRKFCLAFGQFVCGVTLISAAFIPHNSGYNWLIQVLSYTGKAAVSTAFALVFNYSTELFPTVARNAGLGFSSMVARIGGVVVPFITLMGAYTDHSVPITIFGVISLVAGLLVVFFLPETARKPLPETLFEAENFGLTGKQFTQPDRTSGSNHRQLNEYNAVGEPLVNGSTKI